MNDIRLYFADFLLQLAGGKRIPEGEEELEGAFQAGLVAEFQDFDKLGFFQEFTLLVKYGVFPSGLLIIGMYHQDFKTAGRMGINQLWLGSHGGC
jgi:hypothetical protein